MKKEIAAKRSYVLSTSWQNQSIITIKIKIPTNVDVYLINDKNLNCIRNKTPNNWDAAGEEPFSVEKETMVSKVVVIQNGKKHLLFINKSDNAVEIEITAQENPSPFYTFSSSTSVSGLL